MSALEDAQRAEAEAYEALAPAFGYKTMPYDKYVLIRTFAEAVRRTERVRVEALVNAGEEAYEETRPLGQDDDAALRSCAGCYGFLSQGHLPHCWVENLHTALVAYRESQS